MTKWSFPARVTPIAMFLLAALLILPLFQIEYLDNWGTIDSTFIADARFLLENGPHPLWQPLWYCGTRFDYIYPPALRYGTAGLAWVSGVSTAHAYHFYTALLYCLGIAAVCWLVQATSGSWRWAAIAAAAAASLSPSFLVAPAYRGDSFLQMPQRLNVLVKWGEGPHMSALALLPFALGFLWLALRDRSSAKGVAAAFFSALVVAHNFYGAVALVICYCLAVWSIWIPRRERDILVRSLWIGLLACGLSAFWLTPSYLQITIDNLKFVAQPGSALSRIATLCLAIVFAFVSWKLAHRRVGREYQVFLAGATVFFTLIVVGHYYFQFRIVGEPHRLVPELDLIVILAGVEALRTLWNTGSRRLRFAVVGAIALVFIAGHRYLLQPWSVFIEDRHPENRVEYQLTDWISRNLPDARVFATGSLRFWYNAWHNGAQVGGGSEQGLLNGHLTTAQWQVIQDASTGRDIAWLQAVGAEVIAVPEPNGGALFQEFANARKFEPILPVVYRGHGHVLYRVPRRFKSRARIVDMAQVETLQPIPFLSEYNESELSAYARALEEGPDRPAEMRRINPETISIRATLRSGESLIVQESYDPAWRAYSGGNPIPVRKDPAGFLHVYAPTGEQDIELRFELPTENVVGRVVTIMSILIAATILLRSKHPHFSKG